jgi:hypothetical protein
MACLSVLVDGVFVVCSNPIFPISEVDGRKLIFEVFEDDAASLERRRGQIDEYCVDATEPFLGELVSLEMCQSTHPGLALLREKPTMRGETTIHKAPHGLRH